VGVKDLVSHQAQSQLRRTMTKLGYEHRRENRDAEKEKFTAKSQANDVRQAGIPALAQFRYGRMDTLFLPPNLVRILESVR
jgi:hypothetical protein